jgi:hypothetical protein
MCALPQSRRRNSGEALQRVGLGDAEKKLAVDAAASRAVLEDSMVDGLTAGLEVVQDLDELLLLITDSSVEAAQFYVTTGDLCVGLCDALGLLHDRSDDRLSPWLLLELVARVMEKVKILDEVTVRYS